MTDNQCSERRDDWKRFLLSLIGLGTEERHNRPLFDWVMSITHTAYNIGVEELRRWRGEC